MKICYKDWVVSPSYLNLLASMCDLFVTIKYWRVKTPPGDCFWKGYDKGIEILSSSLFFSGIWLIKIKSLKAPYFQNTRSFTYCQHKPTTHHRFVSNYANVIPFENLDQKFKMEAVVRRCSIKKVLLEIS